MTHELEEKVRKRRLSTMKRTKFAKLANREDANRRERERYWGDEEVRKRKRAGGVKDPTKVDLDKTWPNRIKKILESPEEHLQLYLLGGRDNKAYGSSLFLLSIIGPTKSRKYYKNLVNIGSLPSPPRTGSMLIITNGIRTQKKPSKFYSVRDLKYIAEFFTTLIKEDIKADSIEATPHILKLHQQIQGT